jgi:2',3'-cyclic-nucleotide 3'-phosphodiesterase
MPGSSLWLLPPRTHPLTAIIPSLIEKTASHFNSPDLFIPHVTLTSEISPESYASDPQGWIDRLEFPKAEHVKVKFGHLGSQSAFFKKLFIRVDKSGMSELGMVARRTVGGFEDEDRARKWVNEEYMPHLSLLYSGGTVSEAELKEVEGLVRETGINLDGEGELGGWTGGRVVLVPTYSEIKDWVPVAEKNL